MTDQPDLWTRLKEVRVVRVLVVYLGASWLVLQVAQTIVEAFKLPEWVLPSAIILLLIGLVVIVATAWVQSLASTTTGEKSGELPTDWEIAPGDAIASLRKGHLPHLTWGRTIGGGIAMLLLLFAAAAAYTGMKRIHFGGPTPVVASEAATGIAIVPFDVSGTGMDIWREGMMDLLSHGLDGIAGFRAIDSRTVLARWHDRVGDKSADQAATMDVAKETGARYALEGSVVALGPSVRMATTVYDVETGREVARGQAEGAAADVLRLADELAVSTMRSLLTSVGRAGAADAFAGTITTKSLPAMRAYLEGEQFYRKSKFGDAAASFEQAVALDSTFAIALVELSETYAWLENVNSARMKEVGKLAFAQRDKLSPRYQFLMTATDALYRLSPDGLPALKEAVRRYPDDARAWFLLAETYIHVGGATYGTPDDIWQALQQATTLDPGFATYLVHFAENAILRGDREAAQNAIDRYESLTGSREAIGAAVLGMSLILGNEQQADSALKSLGTVPARTLDEYAILAQHNDHLDRDAAVDAAFAAATHTNRLFWQVFYAAAQGAVTRAHTIADDSAVSADARAGLHAYVYELWGVQPPNNAFSPSVCVPVNIICSIFIGRVYARMGRWPEQQKVIENLRAAATATKDSAHSALLIRAAETVRAIGLHLHGDRNGARALLAPCAVTSGVIGEQCRYELAMIEEESRHPAEALRQFNSIMNGFMRPIALDGAGRMYERLGQPDQARIAYTRFLTLTAKGDSLPRIAAVRAALKRLQPKD